MPPELGDMSLAQQAAFILGCEVKIGSNITTSSPEQDNASIQLVGSLWESRSTALELTEREGRDRSSSYTVRRSRANERVGKGVEAHGNYAKLSS